MSEYERGRRDGREVLEELWSAVNATAFYPARQMGKTRLANALKVAGALLAATSGTPAPQETGWLIETNGPEWLCGFGFSANWTKNSLEAIRFARRCDAEKIAECLENCDISITEHIWG